MLLARALRPATRRLRCLSYLASIDQGTSSSRVILYDAESLEPVASHQVELQSATTTPEPGWSQMDPSAILKSVDEAAQGALEKAKASSKVLVDRCGHHESTGVDGLLGFARGDAALYDCILWHDARTRDVPSTPREVGWHRFIEKCHWFTYLDVLFGVKLKWLLDEVPSVRNALEQGSLRFGTVDTWLMHHLTGEPCHGLHQCLQNVDDGSSFW